MPVPDKNQARWIAEVKLYSELPNPSWTLTETLAETIESKFRKFKKQPHIGIPEIPVTGDGYPGINLNGAKREHMAHISRLHNSLSR
jgi:hypothetical protein